jgi:hypothetical protein
MLLYAERPTDVIDALGWSAPTRIDASSCSNRPRYVFDRAWITGGPVCVAEPGRDRPAHRH